MRSTPARSVGKEANPLGDGSLVEVMVSASQKGKWKAVDRGGEMFQDRRYAAFIAMSCHAIPCAVSSDMPSTSFRTLSASIVATMHIYHTHCDPKINISILIKPNPLLRYCPPLVQLADCRASSRAAMSSSSTTAIVGTTRAASESKRLFVSCIPHTPLSSRASRPLSSPGSESRSQTSVAT